MVCICMIGASRGFRERIVTSQPGSRCPSTRRCPHPHASSRLPACRCRVFGTALLLWIPLLPLLLVMRQFLRSQSGASK